ncbi:MAG: fused MFS/spermidine synthase [Patescibacteria group bacterium]|nr:fused MFS/spermidine synthase [Patescibacteria group bacterium]
MSLVRQYLTYGIVFIVGAIILIIEIVAVRLLAIYFGNTIYTVSSILGVILGGLSLGYYLGGYLADRRPDWALFYFLILAGGIFLFLIFIISEPLLIFLESAFDIKVGPVVSSIFIFFLPSLFLGAISPLAIKLKTEEIGEIGRVSGKIFFWSTIGSILGSFIAGFYLIPNFGLSMIIKMASSVLIIIGLTGVLLTQKHNKNYSLIVFLLMALIFLGLMSKFIFKYQPPVIFQKDGVYSRITIEEIQLNGRLARLLKHDRSYQSGIFLDNNELVFDYAKYYSLYRLINPDAKKILFLGGGAYTLPCQLLRENRQIERIDVAEIEHRLYNLAKKYFCLDDNPRLFNHTDDARNFLKKTKEKYDIIFADAYSSFYSIPHHLTTRDFFLLAKEKLSENGFFWANVIGKLEKKDNNFVTSELKTFISVFPNTYFFVASPPAYRKLRNFILIGIKDENKMIDFSRVKGSELDFSDNLIDWKKIDLSSAIILTDDFAPVEYLISKSF